MPRADSDTSDSDDDLERREELKRRQREFAAKRAAKSSAVPEAGGDSSESNSEPAPVRPVCCQLLVEDDFDEYLGLADAFRERKFVVVGADMKPLNGGEEIAGPFVPDVQWCSYKKVAWAAVMKGQVSCLAPPPSYLACPTACLFGRRRQPERATAETLKQPARTTR